MKNAIIYCRFSPRPLASDTQSNEKQERLCVDYARKQGYSITSCFSDSCVSGKLLDRPGLNSAIAFMQSGMVLIVASPDRLARNVLVALTIQERIERKGCSIEYSDGSPNEDTPDAELMRGIKMLFAQWERRRYAARTKKGLARKKQNGEWVGRPPIGYKIVDKKLVEDQLEQFYISRIRYFYEKHRSSNDIAIMMQAECGSIRGKPWNSRTIRKIIARSK